MIKKIKDCIYAYSGNIGKKLIYELKFMKNQRRYLQRLRNDIELNKKGVFYFVIDPDINQPGLADRLKAIISCYYIAKINHFDYKIIFKEPFKLENYLKPNKIDWVANTNELEYCKGQTVFFNFASWHKIPLLNHDKQYHCYNYVGHNILLHIPDKRYSWKFLYDELFSPCDSLKKAIDSCSYLENTYVAVHFRFVNALGSFENYWSKPLPVEEQQKLIEKCKRGLMNICKDNPNCKVLVFSDSTRFLKELSSMPVEFLDTSSIGHINEKSDCDTVLKTFLDFYMIGRAKKVYRVLSSELYKTFFCVYAAQMGDKELIDYEI